jgi:ACS family hexuronate transporter-like MFS transporter
MSSLHPPVPVRAPLWRWWVCGLLLMATMINYMDRLTLNLLATHIRAEFTLSNQGYGWIEGGFGLAFAIGCITFGLIVDRWNVFWIYPLALLGWSVAGFITAFAWNFESLILFRMLLGFFEAANWPCALRTTQRILPPGERAMGNSILQSGAAVGAFVIPVVVQVLFRESDPHTWRLPFMFVGVVGTVWVAFWWLSLRPADLRLHHEAAKADVSLANAGPKLPRDVFIRRFVVLIVLVCTINMTWHYLRAWLPQYLMRSSHGFSQGQTNGFTMAYYAFTDFGALSAGFVSLALARRGMGVHASRRLVFLCGALLTTLCVAVPFIPGTWAVVGLLLLIGFGSLGVFPCYYSFSQDLTTRHQGKVTGLLGTCCWLAMFAWQPLIGFTVDRTGSYVIPFMISGMLPMLGWLALVLLWGKDEHAPVTLPATDAVAEKVTAVAVEDERVTADQRAVEAAKG